MDKRIENLYRENVRVLHLFIIAAASICAILTTIFSLTHGIFEVYPFLYILSIILVVYFFPRRAVLFALGISLLFISLIYLMSFSNPAVMLVSIAWFAIFIAIAVVASSYATSVLEERTRIKNIVDNSQDGILCLDLRTKLIREINIKCAHWLRYDRKDLLGKELSLVWNDEKALEQFFTDAKKGLDSIETEAVFVAHDGTLLRFVISVVLVTHDEMFCSVIEVNDGKLTDEEIKKTLEDLEEQVRQRTAHLEKINEELRAELLERRRFESLLLSGDKVNEEAEGK